MTNYIQLISGCWPFNTASEQLNCAQAALLDCTNIPAQQFCEELCDQLICNVKTQETTIVKLLEILMCLKEVQVGLQALEASILKEMGMSRFFKEGCLTRTFQASDLLDYHRISTGPTRIPSEIHPSYVLSILSIPTGSVITCVLTGPQRLMTDSTTKHITLL
ncbi:hypothetical protein EDB19DRAFT_1829489 [Suillus lakei]|nr:hypothetical protein EDB19DRAFT_1829489 [Suillus lakei]